MIDAEVAGAAFVTEPVAVDEGDQVSSECLYGDYFLNCLVVRTSQPAGFLWYYWKEKNFINI